MTDAEAFEKSLSTPRDRLMRWFGVTTIALGLCMVTLALLTFE